MCYPSSPEILPVWRIRVTSLEDGSISLLDILDGLRRLHAGYDRVQTMRTNYRRFQAAARFNPRTSEDWDILQLRNSDLVRVVQSLQRVRDRTSTLRRSPIPVENRSREVRRGISEWFDAYANDGPEARRTTNAQTGVYVNLHEWSAGLDNNRRDCAKTREELARYIRGYTSMKDLFDTLEQIARRYVQFWPNSAERAACLAHMLDFEACKNSCQGILRNLRQGQSRQGAWVRQINESQREFDPLMSWALNRRNVDRDLERQRPPR